MDSFHSSSYPRQVTRMQRAMALAGILIILHRSTTGTTRPQVLAIMMATASLISLSEVVEVCVWHSTKVRRTSLVSGSASRCCSWMALSWLPCPMTASTLLSRLT